MASNGLKKATALVGYPVVHNARENISVTEAHEEVDCTLSSDKNGYSLQRLVAKVLCNLYTKTLSVLQRMPREAAYRRQTEQVVQQRLQIVQGEASVPSIESKIGCGQVEELIDQAERELSLANKMEAWQPWEPLVSEPPPNQWKWP